MSNHTSRRNFLKHAAGVAVTGWLAADAACLRAAASAKHAIRLGGPLFKAPRDPEELALAYKKVGYRAAYCPGVKLNETERIRDIVQAFAKHDIVIAEVGRWCNLTDVDQAKRAANLQTVTDGLALAEAVGARCAVDIAGSFNPKVWSGPHPKNVTREFFDLAVENARKIIDAVKPQRAKFCYEMMGWTLPDSADSYLELIKAIDRPAFGVHLDPCNVINSPNRFYRNADVINECFDKLGPWITSCHAKDLAWVPEMNVHFLEVPLGTGELDYTTYLKRLASLPADVPLMIEHLKTPEEYDQSREHLFQLGAKIGVRF